MLNKSLGVLLLIIAVSACAQYSVPSTTSDRTGTLQLKVTDQVQNVSSLILTVSEIQVHNAVQDTSTETPVVNETGTEENESAVSGWITVNSQPVQFDLISVKDLKDMLGENNLAAGTYTQTRLVITSAQAVVNGQQVNVTVPSNIVRFVRPFEIQPNKTTSIVFDFDADKSLVMTGDGKYVLKPTVKLVKEFEGKEKSEANSIKTQQAADASAKRQARQILPQVKTEKFLIEADDTGFYLSGQVTSAITVVAGNTVQLTFYVKPVGTYYGGLDFRSSEFNTVSAPPGQNVTVTFTASKTFTITSYWPSTGVRKSNLYINVV